MEVPALKHVGKVNKKQLQLSAPDGNQMQVILNDFICCVSNGSAEDNVFGNWKLCWGALPSPSPPL